MYLSGVLMSDNLINVQHKTKCQFCALMIRVSVKVHLCNLRHYWCDFHTIGFEHKLQFVYCGCESLTVTLVRAQLWPASPQHPRYAFTFSLLDWAEALLLECQVALKDFCAALYFKCPFQQAQVIVM